MSPTSMDIVHRVESLTPDSVSDDDASTGEVTTVRPPLVHQMSSSPLDPMPFNMGTTQRRRIHNKSKSAPVLPSLDTLDLHSDITASQAFNWDDFGNWFTCVAVVTFDLEAGQSIEHIYPPLHSLVPSELKLLSYLAFPDSNSGCQGDHQFFIRLKRDQSEKTRMYFGGKQPTSKFLFGGVYFRQVPDRTSRRGFFQKSIVVMSEKRHMGLTRTVTKAMAKKYFEEGLQSLEAACIEVCSWAKPNPHEGMHLSLCDQQFCIEPNAAEKQSPSALSAELPAHMIYSSLKPLLRHCHALWELVLTAEPIVVITPTPSQSSSTVMALLSLISPAKFCGDFRPYYTIHDPNCRAYANKANPPPCSIIGATNPYFGTSFAHWPHMIRVDDTKPANVQKIGGSPTRVSWKKLGLFSTYKPEMEEDKGFIRLLTGIKPGTIKDREQLGNQLKRHFAELTRMFLIPLEQYLARLMPLKKAMSSINSIPKIGKFDMNDFMESLQTSLPSLKRLRKGNWTNLYLRFLQSPNFIGWWKTKRREANQQLLKMYLENFSSFDLKAWLAKQPELKAVDLLMQVQDALERATTTRLLSEEKLGRLDDQLNLIINELPQDLQRSLRIRRDSPTSIV